MFLNKYNLVFCYSLQIEKLLIRTYIVANFNKFRIKYKKDV